MTGFLVIILKSYLNSGIVWLSTILWLNFFGFGDCQDSNRSPKFIGDSNSDDAFNYLYRDGSYQYGYANRDYGASFHYSEANNRNVVRGRFGSRNPQTRKIDEVIYTAGPRGYRPRGSNIHRRFDLNQNRVGPIGSPDDPYFDPYEDPSYSFGFRTRTYSRQETANRNKDVSGRYTYIDDVGVRHNVEYIAGKNIGFHVKTPFPDTNPNPYAGPLYRGNPRARGHSSIQRGLDGSYRFIAAGPDQRRSEYSDSHGNVRGSYSYLDNHGKQHVVNYIAGPNIGYKVLKNAKDIPPIFPLAKNSFSPPSDAGFDPFDTDFPSSQIDDLIFNSNDDDLFNTAASGHVKPNPSGKNSGKNKLGNSNSNDDNFYDDGNDSSNDLFGGDGSKDSNKNASGSNNQRKNDTFNNSAGGTRFDQNDNSIDNNGYDDGSYNNKRNKNNRGGSNNNGNNDFFDYDYDLFQNGGQSGSSRGGGNKHQGSNNQDGKWNQNDNQDGNWNQDGSNSGNQNQNNDGQGGSQGNSGSENQGSQGNKWIGDTSKSSTSGNSGYDQGSKDGSYDYSTKNKWDQEDIGHRYANDFATLVRNVGNESIHLKPGVAVKAHVQSIDILPYGSRLPSPAFQMNKDSKGK